MMKRKEKVEEKKGNREWVRGGLRSWEDLEVGGIKNKKETQKRCQKSGLMQRDLATVIF